MRTRCGKRDVKCLVILKNQEKAHSGQTVGFVPYSYENPVTCFVDDFISTGETFESVLLWAKDCGVKVDYAVVGHDNDDSLKEEYGIKVITIES